MIGKYIDNMTTDVNQIVDNLSSSFHSTFIDWIWMQRISNLITDLRPGCFDHIRSYRCEIRKKNCVARYQAFDVVLLPETC